jgi:succinate dehydrogenase flavin-adding protein (antitoxin of CptAB toxin-antitoxin module)
MNQIRGASALPSNDSVDARRKRMLLRVLHGGAQETDQFLGRLAEHTLAGFDSAQLAHFEALLDRHSEGCLDQLNGPFRLSRGHAMTNRTNTCPDKLNPARAIAHTKHIMAERT